jgi:oligopeptidase B
MMRSESDGGPAGPSAPAPAATAEQPLALPTPPAPPRRAHRLESPFGTRIDPYFWLRDDARANPEVLDHLRAENAYRKACMAAAAPLEERLYAEMIARIQQDDASVPYRKNGYWYRTSFSTGREYPVFTRRRDEPGAADEVLLDANQLAAEHDYYQIGAIEISPDNRWLAYCEDTVGRREYRLRFKDLATGDTLATAIADVESDIAFANDSRTVLYVAKDPETLLGLYVRAHRIGTGPEEDVLLFEQTDQSFYTGVSKSKSERYLFISMESTLSSEWLYAEADDPALRFKVFFPREADHEYQIEHGGDRFFVRSNWRALNFRLMQAEIGRESDRAAWVDVVAHRADTLIHGFDVFDTFLAVSVRTGGLRKLQIQPLPPQGAAADGSAAAAVRGVAAFIESGEPAYTASLGVNAETNSEVLRYGYTSLTTPPSVYEYDLRSGERRLLKRDPVLGPFDPEDYETRFLFAPARDGKAVPVSIVYRRDTRLDGTAPLLQYGYGAYGLSMDPAFSSTRLSLLDRGFVFALAHVRGGQELGRAWYDDGRLMQKMHTFTDFIDVTEFLVERGIGARHGVFAMGGSAGGLLMGAIANLAPGRYRAIVAQVPFVDVLTTMLDRSIPLTTNEYEEWGNPADREVYEYLSSYSPYDNVDARDYPPMLVTTGLWDSQVQYFEPAKWVAKLRAQMTGGGPVLLHVDMEAGHGGKSGRFQRYREIAMEYAFILDQWRGGTSTQA